MAVSISLTGISPLHGSHAALPIACDAFSAWTVAVREYHYVFLCCHGLQGATLALR